jgi:hypothetical protein
MTAQLQEAAGWILQTSCKALQETRWQEMRRRPLGWGNAAQRWLHQGDPDLQEQC